MAAKRLSSYIANLPTDTAHSLALAESAVVNTIDIDNLPIGSNLIHFPANAGPVLVSSVALSLLAAERVASNDALIRSPSQWLEDSGTSMAAPHVTGAIALLLSRAAEAGNIPSGNQIPSALRQKTQRYSGQWDRGAGYGVIDVAAFLAAF